MKLRAGDLVDAEAVSDTATNYKKESQTRASARLQGTKC